MILASQISRVSSASYKNKNTFCKKKYFFSKCDNVLHISMLLVVLCSNKHFLKLWSWGALHIFSESSFFFFTCFFALVSIRAWSAIALVLIIAHAIVVTGRVTSCCYKLEYNRFHVFCMICVNTFLPFRRCTLCIYLSFTLFTLFVIMKCMQRLYI